MAEEYKGEAFCVKCKEKRAFEGASKSVQTNFSELSTIDFLVSDSTPGTDSDLFDPCTDNNPSNLNSISAQISPNLLPTPPPHRYPINTHRAPSHLACNLSTLPDTTKSSLFLSTSEETEFSIKKGLFMKDYKHPVGLALNKELTKMFVTYNCDTTTMMECTEN
jgi:hypothetical protein